MTDNSPQKLNPVAVCCFMILLIIGVCGVFVLFNSLMLKQHDCSNYQSETFNDESIPIYSVNDKWKITSEAFIIGSGRIHEDPAYTFYTGNSSEGYYLKTVSTNRVRIFMDENDHPYYRSKIQWVDTFAGCFPITTGELHVPNGTILPTYKLDGV